MITDVDRELARRVAAEHHAQCVADGCQPEHERALRAIARAHRADMMSAQTEDRSR